MSAALRSVIIVHLISLLAFDMTYDYEKALEDIVSLGCERILTSGLDLSALEGTQVIKRCIDLVSRHVDHKSLVSVIYTMTDSTDKLCLMPS